MTTVSQNNTQTHKHAFKHKQRFNTDIHWAITREAQGHRSRHQQPKVGDTTLQTMMSTPGPPLLQTASEKSRFPRAPSGLIIPPNYSPNSGKQNTYHYNFIIITVTKTKMKKKKKKTGQSKWPPGHTLGGFLTGSSTVLWDTFPSCHQHGAIFKEYCQPGKLLRALVLWSFTGVSGGRHNGFNHWPFSWTQSPGSLPPVAQSPHPESSHEHIYYGGHFNN